MKLFYGVREDIDEWMDLVTRVRWNFPGLETQEKLDEHRATVLKFMNKQQAICVKDADTIAGVMLFSRGHNMICCLAVSPEYRRRGAATLLMDEALRNLDHNKEIVVSTFRADDEKGPAPRALYEKYGFIEEALIEELNYPNQRYVLYPAGSEQKERQVVVNRMIKEIAQILQDNEPSIYLYGSSVLNDFRHGWSDIDILVLTEQPISEAHAQKLVGLRQRMTEKNLDNPYYRLFEGGMLSRKAFLNGENDRVVYWETTGEKITDTYVLDSFSMTEMVECSVLLYGKDIRNQLRVPELDEIAGDIHRHYETIRNHAHTTGRSMYSFGWMLDIARCIYTIRTGKIIAKTAAGKWALDNRLCPDPEVLEYVLKVRENPLAFKDDSKTYDYAEKLGEPIQRFADVLERELKKIGEKSICYSVCQP